MHNRLMKMKITNNRNSAPNDNEWQPNKKIESTRIVFSRPPATKRRTQQQQHLLPMSSNSIYIIGATLLLSKFYPSFVDISQPNSFLIFNESSYANGKGSSSSSRSNISNTNTNEVQILSSASFSIKPSQHEDSVTRIPHIIHQSYKSISTLPSHWADGPKAWQTYHPNYTYMFWSDVDNRRLIQEHYSWFLPTYDTYPTPIQRADAARYFAVLHYGGVYADMDILPIRNIDPILNTLNQPQHANKELIVAETYNLGLTNALFASIPNSTILARFVQELPYHTRPLHGVEWLVPHFAVLLSTGPTRLWIYLNQYRSSILTIPPIIWGQCHQCQQRHNVCTPLPVSFFETRAGGSWHKWDTRILNFIFCHVQLFVWLVVCIVVWLFDNNFLLSRNTKSICRCKKKQSCDSAADGRVIGRENLLLPQQDDDEEVILSFSKKCNNQANVLSNYCSFSPCTWKNNLVRTRILFATHQIPVFCGIIFVLLL